MQKEQIEKIVTPIKRQLQYAKDTLLREIFTQQFPEYPLAIPSQTIICFDGLSDKKCITTQTKLSAEYDFYLTHDFTCGGLIINNISANKNQLLIEIEGQAQELKELHFFINMPIEKSSLLLCFLYRHTYKASLSYDDVSIDISSLIQFQSKKEVEGLSALVSTLNLPEQQLFLEINNLPDLNIKQGLKLCIYLQGSHCLPEVKTQNLKLYCALAENAYPYTADIFSLRSDQESYPMLIDNKQLLKINKISFIDKLRQKPSICLPYYMCTTDTPSYQLHMQDDHPSGYAIQFRGYKKHLNSAVLCDVRVCDGDKPAIKVRSGTNMYTPENIKAVSLCQASKSILKFDTTLLEAMSYCNLNAIYGVLNTGYLKQFLSISNLNSGPIICQAISAILSINHENSFVLRKGAQWNLLFIQICFSEDAVEHEGGIYLLSVILKKFFQSLLPFATDLQLTITLLPSAQSWDFYAQA